MKKILITGSSGFIGYHLAKKLLKKEKISKIYLIDNFERGQNDKLFKDLINNNKKFIKFLKLDLSKEKSFQKFPKDINVIYHFAAINGTKNFYNIPDRVISINSIITLNLLNYLKDKKNIFTIFSSSSEAYASTTKILKNRIPSDEKIELSIEDISNPRYSYAVSKILGESAFFAYHHRYKIDFLIVRFHNIYGPRMGFDHVIPELIKRIQKSKRNIKLYGHDNTRSFCYIEDATEALSLFLYKKISHKIINIGNDQEEIKISRLSKIILEIMGKNLKIEKLKSPEGSVKRRLPKLKVLKSYGFKPKYNLKKGLLETINWYL